MPCFPLKLNHVRISLGPGGDSPSLVRHSKWASQIAFDGDGKCFVEVHRLMDSQKWTAAERRSWVNHLDQVMSQRHRALPRLLGVGETESRVYAITPVQTGEGLGAFVTRMGPLVSGTSFALTLQWLDDLLKLPGREDGLEFADLSAMMIRRVAGGHLELAVAGLGGGANLPGCVERPSSSELVKQVCHLLFLMLIGREPRSENPEKHPVLTKLPTALRLTMRWALLGGDQAAPSLGILRDQVREGLCAFAGQQAARSPKKLLSSAESLQPENEVERLLFGDAPVAKMLGERFSLIEGQGDSAGFEGLAAVRHRDTEDVTIHLLPPERLMGERLEGAVPLGSWKFNDKDTPNLLQPLCVWERRDWGYLAEKREPGINLHRLLAVRGVLNPAEVLILLQQIRDGIRQAKACGVEPIYLDPSEIFLKVGKPGVMMQREIDRLMERRIDAWPPFTVKLRTHLTTRRFLVTPEDIPGHPENSAHAELLALAAFLLVGESPSGREDLQLAETLPDALRSLLDLTWQRVIAGEDWSLDAFLDQFASAIAVEDDISDLAEKLRGPNVNLEEMECVGSVSDFDNPWTDDVDAKELPSGGESGATAVLSKKKGKARWFFFGLSVLVISVLAWMT